MVDLCKWWAKWAECENNPTFMMQKCQLSCGFCGQPELGDKAKNLFDLENRTTMPSLLDLRGTSLALARLQQIYRILIQEMVGGIIEGVATSVRLSIYDCIRIANESRHEGEYANSYMWYYYAHGIAADPYLKGHIYALVIQVIEEVLNYGITGHYNCHVDPLWKLSEEETWESYREMYSDYANGDRITTWMFYLSYVEAGGRTAFPWAGVSVKPVKGGAVFWYNLKKNGHLNPRSQHGGCPVLIGHKWVSNKWIREGVNFLRRPCSLNPQE